MYDYDDIKKINVNEVGDYNKKGKVVVMCCNIEIGGGREYEEN